MGVVAVGSLVFDVSGRDGDTTFPFFGCLVNRAIVEVLCEALLSLPFGDGSSQGGLRLLVASAAVQGDAYLAMIDVSNGTCIASASFAPPHV